MINLYQTLKSFPDHFRQLTCRDLLFTNYDCPQTEKKESFFIECNFIAFVLSGRRIFHKGDKSWDLHEGVCVFVKKGTHIAEKQANEGWCVMVFFMPDHFLRQLVQENRNSLKMTGLSEEDSDHVLPLSVDELSLSFFRSMIPYFTQESPPPESLLELKFKELVLSLLANKKNEKLLSYLDKLSKETHPSLADVMQKNFSSNLTLPEYAKLACHSMPTFKREFRKIFRESPAKWIMKKRLKLAAELLKNSALTISEITAECGFENQTHFSRVFKVKYGQTPTGYRRNPVTTD